MKKLPRIFFKSIIIFITVIISDFGISSCGKEKVVASCNISGVDSTIGCFGDPVTITGEGFERIAGTVSFNGTEATITSWSDTSIEVNAPGGVYSKITITTAATISCSLSGAYFYDDSTVAVVTITSPTDGVTLYAGDVWVSGTADNDIITVTVTSDQGQSMSSKVNPDGNWSVVLTGVTLPSIIINANGIDNCGNIGTDSVTVSVSEPTIWYVNTTATGDNTGKSWENAFTVIQAAMDTASSDDWIWVAEGTYTTGPSTIAVLIMAAGVEIYGGFTGTESKLSERDAPFDHPTILDGEHASYHVVVGASNARLDGFVVTYGSASAGVIDNSGGGMFNDSVTGLVVSNCMFKGNSASWGGGGGMYNDGVTNLLVANCAFSGNEAADGGGMLNYDVTGLLVANITFSGNIAGAFSGGGMYNSASSPEIINCIFINNSAGSFGGGMAIGSNSSPNINNCTFSGNSAYFEGGGVFILNSTPAITNCILWGNTAPTGSEIALNSSDFPSTLTISYSDVQGGLTTGVYVDPGCILNWGTGMIEDAPMFVNGPNGNYYLSQPPGQVSTSPCVDTGSNTAENLRMDDRTTSTNGDLDTGWVDMGYHYEP